MRLGGVRKLFIGVVAAITLQGGVANSQALTVVADEWPPFSGTQLPNNGLSPDVIATVLTRAGYDVTTSILPWSRVMDGARKGEHDIVGSLFRDADVETFMTYGEPYYETSVKFVRHNGSDIDVTSFESLQPFSIAVGNGFIYEDRFDRAEDLNKVVVDTTLQGLQMVAHGRVDLTLDSEDVLRHSLQQSGPAVADEVDILPFELATHGIHMAIRNSHPDKDRIVADFNRTLAEMRADGSLAEVLNKHKAP